MAVKLTWNRAYGLCVYFMYLAATLQLTLGVALPPINVPSNALPGHKETNTDTHGQVSELISDSDIDNWLHIAKNGATKLKDSLQHLAHSDIAVEARRILEDRSWEDFLNVHREDSSLHFSTNVYRGFIHESPEPDQKVEGVIDLYAASTDPVSYHLTGEDSDNFRLELRSDGRVDLFTTTSVDGESVRQYHLKVLASTQDSKPASADLVIDVINVDNQAPVFVIDSFVSSTYTGAPVGTRVVTVHATDHDEGENGQVSYTMESINDAFSLDPNTGVITVTSPPITRDYTFVVTAQDHGKPPLSSLPAKVTIIVRPLSDKFRPYGDDIVYPPNSGVRMSRVRREVLDGVTANISEIAEVETVVYTVPEQGDGLRYAMGSPVNNKFSVEETTGDITLLQALDFESNQEEILNVQITNASDPDVLDTLEITFEILDGDDLPVWTMSPSPYIAVVPLDAPNLACLYELSATDQDAGTEITYYLRAGGQGWFSVDETSGCINTVVTPETSYQQDAEYILSVVAMGTNAKFAGETIGTVSVFGGSHPPQFSEEEYSASVTEAEAGNQQVITVAAMSFPRTVPVTYSIVGPTNRPTHTINAEDGTITLTQTILAADLPSYFLIVRATEDKSDGLTSDVRVNVEVLDINNCAPTFGQDVLSFTGILETAAVGEVIATAQATDCDSGVNAELTYSITTADSGFTIDSATGGISPAAPLDYEEGPRYYTFDIMAEDGGNPTMSGSTQVVIAIVDANEPPVFTPDRYHFRMDEFAATNYEVGTVYVSDEDVGDTVTLAIIDDDGTFTIDPSTGVISVVGTADQSAYSFNISATDSQNLVSMAMADITITDLNDNIPSFPECGTYAGFVSEDADINTEVITVVAEDGDQGSNAEITYDISSNDFVNIKQYFKIDQNGVIQTARTLNREEIALFSITVQAQDGGVPSLTGFCTFTITVGNVNDEPPSFPFTSYQTAVPSNTPVLDEIIAVAADDVDSASSDLRYTLTLCNTQYFQIDPLSATVFVRKDLSPLIVNGRPSSQDCEVTATDGELSTSVRVTIDVLDPSDNSYQVPVFLSVPYVVNINEDVDILTELMTFIVDGDESVGWELSRGAQPSTNSELTFSVTSNSEVSGYLRNQGELDYETVERYDLIVTAKYPLSLYNNESQVTVNIVDVNDELPIFPASTFYANLLENQAPPTSIIRIQATDKDVTPAFNQITYSIEGDQTDFAIDATSGEITSLTSFDRENVDQVNIPLVVVAFDGKNQNEATVYVNIIDQNDNQPQFNGSYSFEIAESARAGDPVGQVTATDADSSEILEYFLSGGNDGGAFSVNAYTGLITVASVLDYESQTEYTLMYSVNDGLNTETTTVVVNITNVNDVAPLFDQELYTANIVEEDTVNIPRVIVTVDASDGDAGSSSDDIVYSLLGTGVGTVFSIDETSGEITLSQPVDREEIANFDLVAVATDENGNGLSSYVNVEVTVDDINDNSPTFPDQEYVGSVPESQVIGTPVMFVTAEDADTDPLTYSIVGGDSDFFAIDSATGEVRTRTVLDRETKDEFTIDVMASDGVNTATTTATINVIDLDDNLPVFTQDPFPDAYVSESEPEGYTITTVSATDPDVAFRDEVTFSIASGDFNNLFRIVTDTATLSGLIQVDAPLDFESGLPNEYDLVIEVRDTQGVTQPDTTSVSIAITNANDATPEFDRDVYEGSVSEGVVPPANIGVTVVATDNDIEGSDITYSIDPESDPEGQFDIDENGNVMIIKSLDRETTAFYALTALATDSGIPPRTGRATINVVVEDVNDTPPRFDDYEIPTVMENSVEVRQVISVAAVDDDDPASGPPFIYEAIPGPWENYFTIEGLGVSTSNAITVSTNGQPIDREVFSQFDILFSITEATTPEGLVGEDTLTIAIGDENDNPHIGVTKNTLVYSYEGETPEVNLGEIPTTEVGMVAVTDPDVIEDKTYTEEEPFPDEFQLNEDTGDITMLAGTPGGTYRLVVRVSDGGTYSDAISTVIVEVREIPREAVYSSGSIRFSGATAEELIAPEADGTSKLDKLKIILADAVGAERDNLDIFSVLNVEGMERTVDIRYSAHGSPYYPADQLDLAALGVQDQIADLGLTIAQLPVDLCVKEDVCESSCTNVLVVDPTPTVVDAGTASLVAVTSRLEAQCICGARLVTPGSCDSDPCLNGGTCVDVHGGTYRCECPSMFDGPDCQQTKRTFSDGYATFSTLRQCEETSLSLEFLTLQESGTLLYNGPIQPLADDGEDPIDVILLELVDGKARLTINLGSVDGADENLVLDVPKGSLNNGEWHRIDIYRNERYVEMTVDRCEDAPYAESPSSSSLDTSACRNSGETPGENKFLNVNTPLFLGGMSPDFTVPRLTVQPGYAGCIKNLVSDGFLYDLARSGQFSNSDPGCSLTDGRCEENGVPVCNNGTCVADLDSHQCICFPGYNGETCDTELEPYDFEIDSYVTYELLDESLYNDARVSNYQIMVRTREDNGLIWSISNANTYEYIRMELVSGNLQADWHLGDGPVSVTMPDFALNDGAWHAINFDRYDNVVTIKIDGGGGAKETQNRESTHIALNVDASSLIIGANVELSTVTDNYMGCMNDPRINHNYLGLDGTNDYATATKSAGVMEGCVSDVCDSFPCPGNLVCLDQWRFWECVCPVGTEPEGEDMCINIDECTPNPCLNEGVCSEVDPVGFECACPMGYSGEVCQVYYGGQTSNLGLSTLAIVLMILCLLLILILLLSLVLYNRWRDVKTAMSFAVDPEDDIRENFINYDEEGGGEEDNDAYDLDTLRKPVEPVNFTNLDTKPILAEEDRPQHTAMRPPGDDPNVGDFINERLKGADGEGPDDEPRLYDYEGDGSTAGSLSSLNSSSTEEEQSYDYLHDWGPQFSKLADMYGS